MSDRTSLPEELRDKLIAAACGIRSRAYVPYSHFAVGAALLANDGQIYTGVNVENASYGLTICAERNAVWSMVTAGGRRVQAIAICTRNGVTPCGACRQVLTEFAPSDRDMRVFLIDEAGFVRETTLGLLLPDSFGPGDLT